MAALIKFLPPTTSRTTKVTSALTCAVLEWFLIVLLLFNSFLSYLIVKFASFFGLQRPCLWCSRVEHLFEPKKTHNFYRILFCDSHAQEISSLSYCSSHHKLCISQSLCSNCHSDYASPTVHEHMTCSCCTSPFENKSVIASGTDKFLERNVDSIFPPKFCVSEPETELGVPKEEDDVVEIERVALSQNSPEEPNLHGFGRGDSTEERKQKDVKFYVTCYDLHHLTPIVAAAEGIDMNLAKVEHEHQDCLLFVEIRDGNKEIEFVIGSCSSSDTGEEQESNASAIDLLKFDLHDKQDLLISDAMVDDRHEEEVDISTHIGCIEALESYKNGEIYPDDDKRKDATIITTTTSCVNGSEERLPYYGGSGGIMHVSEGHWNGNEGRNGRELGGDGVPTTEQLKAALMVERGALNALYVELEEERNASAVAASHTMAMINRLQGEKAAMKMEALQYQRIMEEQCEYDLEALQLLNELMVKKEEETHDLERELDLYRKRVIHYEFKERMPYFNGNENEDDAIFSIKESLGDFEDERFSMLEQLRILEGELLGLNEKSGSCETCGGFDGEGVPFPLGVVGKNPTTCDE